MYRTTFGEVLRILGDFLVVYLEIRVSKNDIPVMTERCAIHPSLDNMSIYVCGTGRREMWVASFFFSQIFILRKYKKLVWLSG